MEFGQILFCVRWPISRHPKNPIQLGLQRGDGGNLQMALMHWVKSPSKNGKVATHAKWLKQGFPGVKPQLRLAQGPGSLPYLLIGYGAVAKGWRSPLRFNLSDLSFLQFLQEVTGLQVYAVSKGTEGMTGRRQNGSGLRSFL